MVWGDGSPPKVAFELSSNADAIAAGLASLVTGQEVKAVGAGQLAEMADLPRLTHGSEQDPRWPQLPACHSVLERWQPVAYPSPGAVRRLDLGADGRWSESVFFATARRLTAALPDLPERPVMSTSPDLPASGFLAALAWSLARGSAWTLEPDSSRLFGCLRWARPHVVFATSEQLPLLAELPTRHRRLRCVLVAGSSDLSSAEWQDKLGAPVLTVPALEG